MKLSGGFDRYVASFFALAFFFSIPHLVFSAETNRPSGLLRAFGGLLGRDTVLRTNTNLATNVSSLHSALESLASTNVLSVTERLGAFLNTNSPGGPTDAAVSSITQKLRDWLELSQTSGTNIATNSLAQRAWVALTNAISVHSLTNSNGNHDTSTLGSLSGTNLVQKLKEWLAVERSTSASPSNGAFSSLATLDGYLSSLQAPISTSTMPSLVTNHPSFGASQSLNSFTGTNFNRRNFRPRE